MSTPLHHFHKFSLKRAAKWKWIVNFITIHALFGRFCIWRTTNYETRILYDVINFCLKSGLNQFYSNLAIRAFARIFMRNQSGVAGTSSQDLTKGALVREWKNIFIVFYTKVMTKVYNIFCCVQIFCERTLDIRPNVLGLGFWPFLTSCVSSRDILSEACR
jgi:hypothetical protein